MKMVIPNKREPCKPTLFGLLDGHQWRYKDCVTRVCMRCGELQEDIERFTDQTWWVRGYVDDPAKLVEEWGKQP